MNIKKYKNIYNYMFDDSDNIKSVIICGDIHGEFRNIVNKITLQYSISDSVIIIAGDCGFGFYKYGYYENMYRRVEKRLKENNNRILFVRGNHDNPAYFTDDKSFVREYMCTVPDYSVISVCNHNILCVGGGASIDRVFRQTTVTSSGNYDGDERFKPDLWWKDELPVYSPNLLSDIYEGFIIDTVVSHTAPSFCEKISKEGIDSLAPEDSSILEYVISERDVMDQIYEDLKENVQPINHWYYGHFHDSWRSNIMNTVFCMLDINELSELK